MNFLFVFLGGGLGSICRYGISVMLRDSTLNFPLATFIANIISCIVLGALVGLTVKNQLDQKMQLMLLTGFCGGFSTFSTFSNETFQLIQGGQHSVALLNILASILVCLICIFLGMKLTT